MNDELADPRELFQQALALHHCGELDEAERLYAQILRQSADHFDALHLSGVVALQTGQTERGIDLIRRAIAINTNSAAAHNNLGVALRDLGRGAEAVESFDRAIALKQDYAEAYNNRGNAQRDLNRFDDCLASFDEAIALQPDFAAAYTNRGNALSILKRHTEALADYDRSIALRPDDTETHNNRGIALSFLERFDEALADYDRAIALSPDGAEIYENRGSAMFALNRFEEANSSFDTAIALRPGYARAYGNRGITLAALRRFDDALADYDQAIALRPDYPEFHELKGIALLATGQFDRGWPLFEWRKRTEDRMPEPSYEQPHWFGDERVAGKTVFLHWGQGFGDTIQFCRYAKMVRALDARVVMSVQNPLVRLLRQLEPDIAVIGEAEVPADFDYHCDLMSLPLAFRTTLESIPAEPSYLSADPRLNAKWSARLPPSDRPSIGLVWSGRSIFKNDSKRSIAFKDLEAITRLDANWVCLQTEIRESDVAALGRIDRIGVYADELTDFAETAALIQQLDLVISVDTAAAHLAAAMGKPVWILNRFNACWRWLTDRTDSPWYPSVRLFNQPTPGDWPSVIEDVRRELSRLFEPS